MTDRRRMRLLHEEIQQLSDDLREPVLLCWLNGSTTLEASRSLGCSPLEMALRLDRAGQVIQERLDSRGVRVSTRRIARCLARETPSPSKTIWRALVEAAREYRTSRRWADCLSDRSVVLADELANGMV